MCKLKSNNGKIRRRKKTQMQVMSILYCSDHPGHHLCYCPIAELGETSNCVTEPSYEKSARNYWHEHEIPWKIWFSQENSVDIADRAIGTITAHREQVQKMLLADFKFFPLVSILSAHGWEKWHLLILRQKISPDHWRQPLEIREHILFQDLHQQVSWHLSAAASPFELWETHS